MKQFKGRVITPGEVTAEAVVTKQGFNTLASFQMALQFGDKEVKCGDQNNDELHGIGLATLQLLFEVGHVIVLKLQLLSH